MTTLAEVRTKYPQYNDLSDVDLANALHKKFYSDIPQNEFYSKIGMGPPSEEWKRRAAISADRAAHPIKAGIRNALTGITGMTRGALNAITPSDLSLRENVERMRDIKIAGALGERSVPQQTTDQTKGYGDRLFHPEYADKESGAYLAGQFGDPVAWYAGLQGAKLLPYAKVLGGGLANAVKATAQNIAGGAVPSAVIGGLSEDGDSASGAGIGALLNVVLPPSISMLGTAAKKTWEKASSTYKAKKILEEILGADLPAFLQAVRRVPGKLTAAQAASGLNNDLLNALDALSRRMDESNYFSRLDATQKAELAEGLVGIAGGRTQTEVRAAIQSARTALGRATEPFAQEVMTAANAGGRGQRVASRLNKRAETLRGQASDRVEDVRRLSRAGQTAESVAQTGRMNLGGEPTSVLGQEGLALGQGPPYSRGVELMDVAERGAQKAADESLALGASARSLEEKAKRITDDLAARGLSPLDTSKVTGAIRRLIKDPRVGPRTPNERALSLVADKIDEWAAKNGGVIDAEALRTIRSSAINDAVEGLLTNPDPKSKAKITASLLAKIKPVIDDAIEKAAGPKGKLWRQYLFDYERNTRLAVDRKKMGGIALRAFEKDPDKLESLAAGNEPKIVKKVFGVEEDLDVAMGTKGMQPIEAAASALKRDRLIKEGAARGDEAMLGILGRHKASWILPNWINAKIAITNRALKEVELVVNKRTMAAVNQAMRSGKDANALLSAIPPEERSAVIAALMKTQNDPRTRAFLMGVVSASQ